MQLRPALQRAPVTPQRLAWVRAELVRIEELLDRDDAAADAAITAFNAATGHDISAEDLRHHCGAPSLEELADLTSAPPPARLPDITRDELVELVRRILADPADDWSVEAFERNTVMPDASSLIHYPPDGLHDPTAEQIVDAALAYRPIAL